MMPDFFMDLLSYFYIFSILIYAESSLGNDHDGIICTDHETLVIEYLAYERQFSNDHEIEAIQVIISDLDGNIIRQIEMKGNSPENNLSKILKPVIEKAIFLIEIDGIYYYLYPKISELEKK